MMVVLIAATAFLRGRRGSGVVRNTLVEVEGSAFRVVIGVESVAARLAL
jgi:hypothetical protein